MARSVSSLYPHRSSTALARTSIAAWQQCSEPYDMLMRPIELDATSNQWLVKSDGFELN